MSSSLFSSSYFPPSLSSLPFVFLLDFLGLYTQTSLLFPYLTTLFFYFSFFNFLHLIAAFHPIPHLSFAVLFFLFIPSLPVFPAFLHFCFIFLFLLPVPPLLLYPIRSDPMIPFTFYHFLSLFSLLSSSSPSTLTSSLFFYLVSSHLAWDKKSTETWHSFIWEKKKNNGVCWTLSYKFPFYFEN